MEFEANVPDYLLQENQETTPENVALFKAALLGSIAGVEGALKKGGTPNYFFNPEDQKNALHVACESGNEDVVNLLLENGAVVDASSGATHSTPLMCAAQCNNAKIIKILLNHKANAGSGKIYYVDILFNLVIIELHVFLLCSKLLW